MKVLHPGTPKTKQSSRKESNILRVSFGKHREAETDSSFTMLSKANELSVAAIGVVKITKNRVVKISKNTFVTPEIEL